VWLRITGRKVTEEVKIKRTERTGWERVAKEGRKRRQKEKEIRKVE